MSKGLIKEDEELKKIKDDIKYFKNYLNNLRKWFTTQKLKGRESDLMSNEIISIQEYIENLDLRLILIIESTYFK